jgi:hypothetical protein
VRSETETIEISGLPPGTRKALEQIGLSSGKSLEEYARLLIEARVLAQRPFKEILAPVRKGFRESGMSESEFDAFVENARERFHKEDE